MKRNLQFWRDRLGEVMVEIAQLEQKLSGKPKGGINPPSKQPQQKCGHKHPHLAGLRCTLPEGHATTHRSDGPPSGTVVWTKEGLPSWARVGAKIVRVGPLRPNEPSSTAGDVKYLIVQSVSDMIGCQSYNAKGGAIGCVNFWLKDRNSRWVDADWVEVEEAPGIAVFICSRRGSRHDRAKMLYGIREARAQRKLRERLNMLKTTKIPYYEQQIARRTKRTAFDAIQSPQW